VLVDICIHKLQAKASWWRVALVPGSFHINAVVLVDIWKSVSHEIVIQIIHRGNYFIFSKLPTKTSPVANQDFRFSHSSSSRIDLKFTSSMRYVRLLFPGSLHFPFFSLASSHRPRAEVHFLSLLKLYCHEVQFIRELVEDLLITSIWIITGWMLICSWCGCLTRVFLFVIESKFCLHIYPTLSCSVVLEPHQTMRRHGVHLALLFSSPLGCSSRQFVALRWGVHRAPPV
jgi:hypothetical protein